jgi:hypothetical protein
MVAQLNSRHARFALATFLLALSGAPAFAAGEQLDVKYSVRMIGLPLGTAGLSAKLDPASYNIEVSARLAGLATIVSRAQGVAQSSGSIAQGRVQPRAYATTSSNSKETRTVRMAMNGGAVRAVDVAPPLEPNPHRVPVTEAHKRGIVDPLSALVMPVAGRGPLTGAAACDRTLPVFDGYARFDVSLSYAGTREVRAPAYKGPVAVCTARYTAISGHRQDRASTRYMENNRSMEVWLMPVENARVVTPYKISVATQMGTVVIEATAVSLASAGGAARSATR